jgi:toxin ParE1/3/4
MTKVVILNEAQQELQDIVTWYDKRHYSLGLDFLNVVKETISLISDNPEIATAHKNDTRRYLIKRFPYVIVYTNFNDKVWIIAFAHCKRKPGYWEKRIAMVNERDI